MEEKQRKELIKKIIEEQDIVALYTYDGFNKSLGIMQEYSKGILYSELKKFILQNSEMLKKFTTKNLYTLLASTYDESEKQIINEQIAERLEKEDFFCEDIDSEVFLHPIHTYDSYGKIDKDVRNKINIELEKQLKELGKEYEIIDKKRATYYGIGMALNRLVKAVLNDENAILTVSTYQNGEYEQEGLYIGVPAIINKNGVKEILKLKLSNEDQAKFDHSCDIMKENIKNEIDINRNWPTAVYKDYPKGRNYILLFAKYRKSNLFHFIYESFFKPINLICINYNNKIFSCS